MRAKLRPRNHFRVPEDEERRRNELERGSDQHREPRRAERKNRRRTCRPGYENYRHENPEKRNLMLDSKLRPDQETTEAEIDRG